MILKKRNFFVIPKVFEFLEVVMLNEACSLTYIHLETRMTYAYVHKISKELEKRGLINSHKAGRQNKIGLTKEGREVAKHYIKIKKIARLN